MVHDASQRKKLHLCLLKSNTEQCFNSTLYRTIYRCIVINQRQYIDASIHCIVATLVAILHNYAYKHLPVQTHSYIYNIPTC